ncbi:MAG: DinB family protein [Vicinamibacterales bacterium]
MPITSDISLMLLRELDGFTREVQRFPDDASLWTVVPGVSNSAGNLALHVSGNLQHFVGALLGGSGYVRNRDAEFGASQGTRDGVVASLTAAADAVHATLAKVEERTLDEPMPGAPGGLQTTTGRFLLHLVAHTAFHLGQAGYLRRIVTGGSAGSAGPLPLDVLGAGGVTRVQPPAMAPIT